MKTKQNEENNKKQQQQQQRQQQHNISNETLKRSVANHWTYAQQRKQYYLRPDLLALSSFRAIQNKTHWNWKQKKSMHTKNPKILCRSLDLPFAYILPIQKYINRIKRFKTRRKKNLRLKQNIKTKLSCKNTTHEWEVERQRMDDLKKKPFVHRRYAALHTAYACRLSRGNTQNKKKLRHTRKRIYVYIRREKWTVDGRWTPNMDEDEDEGRGRANAYTSSRCVAVHDRAFVVSAVM